MSVCFPAPLDENMRLKLILQRRVTEVRALQELRAQQERRKQHIVDLRSRLEHRKRECVEAVEQCKRRAEVPRARAPRQRRPEPGVPGRERRVRDLPGGGGEGLVD